MLQRAYTGHGCMAALRHAAPQRIVMPAGVCSLTLSILCATKLSTACAWGHARCGMACSTSQAVTISRLADRIVGRHACHRRSLPVYAGLSSKDSPTSSSCSVASDAATAGSTVASSLGDAFNEMHTRIPNLIGTGVSNDGMSSNTQAAQATQHDSNDTDSWQPEHGVHLNSSRQPAQGTNDAAALVSSSSSSKVPRVSKEEIERRIQANRSRRAARQPYTCPACRLPIYAPPNIPKHLQTCCPDIYDAGAWEEALAAAGPPVPAPAPEDPTRNSRRKKAPVPAWDEPRLRALMEGCREREEGQRVRCLDIAFRTGEVDGEGQPVKHGPEEIAQRMGLSVDRCACLLKDVSRMSHVSQICKLIRMHMYWDW